MCKREDEKEKITEKAFDFTTTLLATIIGGAITLWGSYKLFVLQNETNLKIETTSTPRCQDSCRLYNKLNIWGGLGHCYELFSRV